MRNNTTQAFLNKLVLNTKSRSAFINTASGLAMFSSSKDNEDHDYMAALSTTIFSLSEKLVSTENNDNLNQVIFENTNGNIIIKTIAQNTYLTLFSSKNTDLKIIQTKIDETISKIKTPILI